MPDHVLTALLSLEISDVTDYTGHIESVSICTNMLAYMRTDIDAVDILHYGLTCDDSELDPVGALPTSAVPMSHAEVNISYNLASRKSSAEDIIKNTVICERSYGTLAALPPDSFAD
jgi:hypothetical protein